VLLQAGRAAASNALDLEDEEASSLQVPKFPPMAVSPSSLHEETAKDAQVSSMGMVEYLKAIAPDNRYGRISQDVQYTTLWEELLTLPMRKPRSFNVVVATAKTWLADIVVQSAEVRAGAKARVDWNRNRAFALFGFFYVGLLQWFLYVSFMAYVAPSAIVFSNEPWQVKLHDWRGQEDLMKQVVVDNLFLTACIYFPFFYMIKEVATSGSLRTRLLVDGLRRYRNNFVSDNVFSMLIWVPGDVIAFAAPMYLRLPLDHTVSFGFTMMLSYRRGSTPAKKVDGDNVKSAMA